MSASDDPGATGPDPGADPSRDQELAQVAASDPGAVTDLLPSPMARAVGLVCIIAAGAAGGFIGYAVTDLQCTGDCSVQTGIGGLVGAIFGAIGVGIVVQLGLRAMFEWRVIEAKGGPEAERLRQKASERRQPPTTRPRPRVQ